MKQQSASKPKITTQLPMLPEIKRQSKDSMEAPLKLMKPAIQNPLSLSRISRQSSSIETTISQESQRKQQQSKKQTIEPLVKNKTYFNHRTLMNDYLKRQNISIATKVFCFNSQDEYVRRCLQRHGWLETPCNQQIFDLKWVYNDTPDDFKTLVDGQFYNHFSNTKELTTKSCLLANFKNQCEYGYDTSTFFPRAFDLGNATDRDDFLKEYERTAVTIILKKAIIALRVKRKNEMKKIKEVIFQEWKKKEENSKIRRIDMKRTVKRKYKNIYTAQELQDSSQQSDIKFDCSIMSEVLSRLSDMKRQLKDGFYDDKNFELSQQYISRTRYNIITYSQNQKFDKGSNPSKFLIRKLYRYHLFFKKYDPAYKVDGVHNIWIIKPGGCARGSGIYLEKDIAEAINSGQQMQARLVQKYIERPLLYKGFKFDLRQWVLVRSFQPLQAFVFSHCYMRMCSQPYDVKDTKNLLKHLTNFSLNKSEFKNKNDSIYSSDFMQQWLPVDWQKVVRPQCNELMIKTLKILQDQFEGESKYCFELFGFDIMLDEYCKPWLLEVNLSPACAERADWLHEMLDSMAESMFNIVFGDEFIRPKKYYYELLIDEEQNYNNQQQNDGQFELWGQKCNIRREKMIDKRYIDSLAALMIQKFYRMYKAKKIKWFLRDTKYAIVIQKYVRRMLAKLLRIRLKKYYSARKLQTLIRGFLAKKRKFHLKRAKMATKIQCRFRCNQAIQIKSQLKRELALLYLEQLISIKISSKLANELKQKLFKYKRIQRWWKVLYRKRVKQSAKINSLVKCFIQKRKYKKLLKNHRSAIVIQKNYKRFQAIKLRKRLEKEQATLLLQCLMKIKLAKRQQRLEIFQKGLNKFTKAYGRHKSRVAMVNIWNMGLLRVKAIGKIQSYRLVIKSKRYARRLKRLKKFIRLQAFIKGFLQRKRYRRLIKRKRAIKLIIKCIRKYIFKKKIKRRIQQKKGRGLNLYSQQPSKANTIQTTSTRNSQTIQQFQSQNAKKQTSQIPKKK
ncbi:unnamed protein product (macronuclear) [Paramecium tetraurelia]|uniref:Tubulin-tyrosine ligase family protein n=1 Tax=Paramecium tetraurelia TaxID=5888 RepID=A0C5M3_PARTE|nr:uncharacterized protein GSPATT00035219001 [Paramecium tetraurelia]CAK66090.1 unnamed protein product [Paramecium tetraurelia]|eukprot:XP_001433487.1 hypothetical protein (macronuclear) [Paramecium tetraurelia strain d4-2]